MTDPQTPVVATKPAAGRRLLLALAIAVPVLGAAVYGWRALHPPLSERVLVDHSALRLNLERPDGLIESQSLAALPRDLLQIPILRDTLTEDFVFYYEGNADRLGVVGALRRIAYEHELGFKDSLLQELLDQAAEVALWRSSDGKLGHLLLTLERGALARLLQPLGQVAADDKQLSAVGELHVSGDAVPLYQLRYNADRQLLFAAYGDRLVVLSSPGMLLDADGALGRPETEALERRLAGGAGDAAAFGLGALKVRHRITLSASYLAMGYGQFIPQLAGLRLEMDDDGWRGQLAVNAIDGNGLNFGPLWSAMPMGAGLCAAAPLASSATAPLFERLSPVLAPALAARLKGPVALCWYGKSRLHTPLVVSTLDGAADASELDAALGDSFSAMIGAYEEQTEDGRFPVESETRDGAQIWKRVVGSDFGLHAASDFEQSELLSSRGYFQVALARHGQTLLFSLDDTLVDQALATLERRFPPLAEQLPTQGPVPLYLASAELATLLEKETAASLPTDMEAILRNAADTQLLPKLQALATHDRYALSLPADAKASQDWTWLPLQWKAL